MKILKSPVIATLLGTILYFLVTALAWKSPSKAMPTMASIAPVVPGENMHLWNTSNPDLELFASELKKQKEALAVKETQLNDLASRLAAERQELMVVTQQVAQLQSEFNANIVRVKEDETGNLKKLAKTYASMTPEGATLVFKEMDDLAVVKIMSFMKETETAPILEAIAKQGDMEAKRVAAISERIRLSIVKKKNL
jgi:flagellar motility protein MotE (MotC chaperone)